MKKKIFALVMAVMMLAMILTSCIQNDISVKMKKDGTGSISATIGIKKDFYQNLKQMGSDPFEGHLFGDGVLRRRGCGERSSSEDECRRDQRAIRRQVWCIRCRSGFKECQERDIQRDRREAGD